MIWQRVAVVHCTKTTMEFLHTLGSLLLILSTSSFTSAAKKTLPKDMHRDMYCIGCEMTMKVVDRVLRGASKEHLDVTAVEALSNVCKPEVFDISEFSKHTMAEACEHLVGEHGRLLEAVLVSHYSQEAQSSYLDLVQRVCMDLTGACHGVRHDHHDHDPLNDDAKVTLDPETNQFVVLPGKKLKIAKPVVQVHEDL